MVYPTLDGQGSFDFRALIAELVAIALGYFERPTRGANIVNYEEKPRTSPWRRAVTWPPF